MKKGFELQGLKQGSSIHYSSFHIPIILVVLVVLTPLPKGPLDSKPMYQPSNRALASLNFGDTRSTVYQKVTEDSRLQFVNPNVMGAVGITSSGGGQPNPTSIFTYKINGQKYRILFNFSSKNELSTLKFRGTSYDINYSPTKLNNQFKVLEKFVNAQYGSPSDTKIFQLNNLKNQDFPVWVQKWNRLENGIYIRLGYQSNKKINASSGNPNRSDDPSQKLFVVLKKFKP